MWSNKQSQTDSPRSSASQEQVSPVTPISPAATLRPGSPTARNLSFLGPSLEIKGKISGEEDLQIDCKVEGPITLQGQKLIAGRSAQLHSEIAAREVVVYGKVQGNVRAQDRVEIKKDGSVVGDISTARISIEDGAYFKGRIEIERSKALVVEEPESVLTPVPVTVG
ncbi:MAG TPA: polymer-forming cytoskeletal protein [Candidatus Acidoferrales bacterium]